MSIHYGWDEKESEGPRETEHPTHDRPVTLVTAWPEMEHDAMLVPEPKEDNHEQWLKYSGELMEREDWRQE